MPQAAPIIGIIAASDAAASPFAEAIRRSGGEPRMMLPNERGSPEEAVRSLAGVLAARQSEPLGLATLSAALERDLPVLAVGHGIHALNIALGGAGAVDVSAHGLDKSEDDSTYHRIYISPGSKLASVVGSGGFVRVNSRHRVGLREPQKSPRLLASAYSLDDGVIEALESPDHRWVIGVQFHPERRREIPPHFDRLFQGLVAQAGEASRTDASV